MKTNECTAIIGIEKNSLLTCATEDEIFVAGILSDLPGIIRENESCLRFKWGSNKRRRSRMNEGASSSRAPSPSLHQRKSKAEAAEEEAAAGSPVTPLSYAPTSEYESDDKQSTHAFKKSSVERETGNVTKYYNKLNTCNSELKVMKQEVLINSFLKKKEPETEIIGKESTRIYHQISVTPNRQPHSWGPITAQFYSPFNGLGSVHGLGIPDLNISAGEGFGFDLLSQPLDVVADRRARFADARRMRKGIIKIKSMRRACGIKLPGTR